MKRWVFPGAIDADSGAYAPAAAVAWVLRMRRFFGENEGAV
jgi:hypothetical protein